MEVGMSWLSDTVNKARDFTDKAGKNLGMSGTQRKYFRYGVSSMGGGMGLQYEYSRNKGMNSDEATKNATTGGMQYEQTREMQKARAAEEQQKEAAAAMERARIAEDARARGQIAARIRRTGRDGTTRPGSIATSSTGLGSTGTFGSFASLLGL
jgi:hypothetical protein